LTVAEGHGTYDQVSPNSLARPLDAQPPLEATMALLALVRRTDLAFWVAVAIAALLLAPAPARAQAVKGTLLGTVTDSTGAGVPGAVVTVTEVQTGISRHATTNSSGNYTFSNLKDGLYRVEAELTGFRKTARENVKVD